MSPDLERLLNALWERETGEPENLPRWTATIERLISDALSKQQGLSREQFIDAVMSRYPEFRRARRKPSTLPPKA